MIDLPKRSDPIYKEIEGFKDYEFTNCIAYEMAIRNNKFNETILEIYKQNLTLNKIEKKNEEFYKILELYSDMCDYLKKTFFIDYNDYLSFKKTNKTFSSYEYFERINKDEYSLINKDMILNIKISEGVKFISKISLEHEDEYKWISIENEAIPIFSRPKIIVIDFIDLGTITDSIDRKVFDNLEGKEIKIDLNFSLPKDELIAYISKIKDEYDKDNSIIKSPLELLGEDFEKSNNKKINKKLIADKFFIYDYVSARLEQIKEDNLSMYEEYEEQKQEIINNKYIDPSDRKIQLKELKREFEENTNTRINEIFEDIEGFAPSTARRYYYGEKKKGILGIKNFIDDCKYKELITGITAK